ncbi:MAG: hypothetical protein QXN01_00805 [Candidatus Anstonellales archaeon]
MRTCSFCGQSVKEYELHYINGLPACVSCEDQMQKVGSEIPCQRCGIYVPTHELKMFRSRLFCNYCIMDMEDEQRSEEIRIRKNIISIEREDLASDKDEIHSESSIGGICEKCQINSDILYFLSGKKLCKKCFENFTPDVYPSSGSSFFGSAILIMKKIADKLYGKNITINLRAKAEENLNKTMQFIEENKDLINRYPIQIDRDLWSYVNRLSIEEKARFYEGYLTLILSDNSSFDLGYYLSSLPPKKQSKIIFTIYFLSSPNQNKNSIATKVDFDKVKELIKNAKEER